MFEVLTTPEGIDAQISVCQQVFLTMTGMEMGPLEHGPLDADGMIASVLRYRGVCDGALMLQCSTTLASAFASRLMGIPAPTRFDDDVRDSLGELVNMVGGNLKGLLPAETMISAPAVFAADVMERSMGLELSTIAMGGEFGGLRMRLFEG